jgi:hypothetical protein
MRWKRSWRALDRRRPDAKPTNEKRISRLDNYRLEEGHEFAERNIRHTAKHNKRPPQPIRTKHDNCISSFHLN